MRRCCNESHSSGQSKKIAEQSVKLRQYMCQTVRKRNNYLIRKLNQKDKQIFLSLFGGI